jgi:septation ring formation regulator EzrA
MECGLFKPEQGESQMWGQRNSKFAAAMGIQLLARIHHLESQLGDVGHQQNHPVDRLEEHINFIGNTSDHIGSIVDKLNSRIDAQEVQIEQLANMVNDLVGKSKGQAKEIKNLKVDRESHRKVINTMTTKVITLGQCVEDVQKKAFPKVRESGVFGCFNS